MIINYQKPSPVQLDHLYRLDLHTFEKAWEYDDWMAIGSREYIRAACVYGRAVGCVVAAQEIDGDEGEFTGAARILKLMVQPEFRRKGIATRLLENFYDWCREYKFQEVNLIVPETICVDACAAFLKAREIKAYKVTRRAFEVMGKHEDGFHFRKDL